ncbi:MAG TPA: TIR domain-containing protein [Thermoanaerobaculia bacterium]
MKKVFEAVQRLGERLLAYVFGRDVFISYAHADGRPYARALANALTSLDKPLRPYLDLWAASPGATLPLTLLLALRRASVLVVIATDEALKSPHVAEEIKRFAPLARPIVAIAAPKQRLCWPSVVDGVSEPESEENITAGRPSAQVIRNIVEVVGDATQEQRLHRLAWRTALWLCFVVLLGAGVTVVAWQLTSAAGAVSNAVDELADTARLAARRETAKAAGAVIAANDAERRRGEAEGLRATAQAQAEKQRRLGAALSLANEASVILDKLKPDRLTTVAQLAAQAMMETNRLGVHSLQVDQTVRQVLDLMPTVHDPLQKLKYRKVLAISPRQTVVAIEQRDRVAFVDLVTTEAMAAEGLRPAGIWRIVFSADESRCGVVTGVGPESRVLRVWDVASGRAIGPPIPLPPRAYEIALDRTGEHAAVAYGENAAAGLTVRSTTAEPAAAPPVWKARHIDSVNFSPVAPLLVFSDRKHLFTWRWQTESQPTRIGEESETGAVRSLLFAPTGELFAASARGGPVSSRRFRPDLAEGRAVVEMWSFASGGAMSVWRDERQYVYGLALSRASSKLLVWDDNGVTVHTAATGVMEKTITHPSTSAAAVSEDGTIVASVGTDGTTRVFDMDRMLELDRVVSLASPAGDGRPALGVDIDEHQVTVVTRSRIQRWAALETPVTRQGVIPSAMAFLPDEEVIVVLGLDKTFKAAMYSAAGATMDSWVERTANDTAIAAASRRRVLVGDRHGDVAIHTPSGPLSALRHPANRAAIVALAVSPSSELVAAATTKGVCVWTNWATSHRQCTRLPDAGMVKALAFNSSGDELVTGNSAGEVHVWDWRARKKRLMMTHGAPVTSLSIDRSDALIASAGGHARVNVWNARTGVLQQELPHDREAEGVAFDPSGKYLATTAWDYLFRLWHLEADGSMKTVARVPFGTGVNRVAFSPSGRTVAYGGRLTLSLWRPEDLLRALCARVDCSEPARHEVQAASAQ